MDEQPLGTDGGSEVASIDVAATESSSERAAESLVITEQESRLWFTLTQLMHHGLKG